MKLVHSIQLYSRKRIQLHLYQSIGVYIKSNSTDNCIDYKLHLQYTLDICATDDSKATCANNNLKLHDTQIIALCLRM